MVCWVFAWKLSPMGSTAGNEWGIALIGGRVVVISSCWITRIGVTRSGLSCIVSRKVSGLAGLNTLTGVVILPAFDILPHFQGKATGFMVYFLGHRSNPGSSIIGVTLAPQPVGSFGSA